MAPWRQYGVVWLLAAALAALPALADEASKLFKAGQKAERAGKMEEAYLLYSRAAALAPRKRVYWLKSQAVRTKAALQGKWKPPASIDGLDEDSGPPPDNLIEVNGDDLNKARQPLPPYELKAAPGRKDFHLHADFKGLWEQVARAFGLDVVFDGEYEAGKTIRFDIEQADYRDALYALRMATNSFLLPLGERLFLVAKDTTQKRTDVEPTMTAVIPIPGPVTIQEAQELARSVQQLMEVKRFGVDSQRRLVLINDRVSKVRTAQAVFEDLLYQKPEVAVELDFVEINRNDVLNLGLTIPNSFSIVNLSRLFHFQMVPSVPSALQYLVQLGGGRTLFGVGIADAAVIANFSRSNASTLLRTTVRSSDGQAATFHVGDRYPILVGGYYGPQNFSQGGQVYTPPPQVQFEDLGLMVKITPKVHGTEEVSLDVEADFKVLTGQAVNGIPIIASRKLASKVRLRNDEWGVVAGLMSATDARTISGLAGLAQIPGLGWLLRQNTKNKDQSEILILMKPRLLSLPPSEWVTHAIWVGTDTRPMAPL